MGILFMVLAMAGFAIEDLVIKLVSVRLPVSQILIMLGLLSLVWFVLIAQWKRIPLLTKEMLNWPFIIRFLKKSIGSPLERLLGSLLWKVFWKVS